MRLVVYSCLCDGPQGVAYAQRLGPNTVYILAGEERRELLLHLELDRSLIKDAPGPCTEPVGRRPGPGPTPFPGLSARNKDSDFEKLHTFGWPSRGYGPVGGGGWYVTNKNI